MCERLSEHTQHLPALKIGDSVRVQNQRGPHPTKWDHTGLVIEVRQFDQYLIRIDGSGRVTLRNRKFLRKYIPVIQREPLLNYPSQVKSTQPPVQNSQTTKPPPNQTQPSDLTPASLFPHPRLEAKVHHKSPEVYLAPTSQ